jgi:hypothetical protein
MRHLRGGKAANSLRGATNDPQLRRRCPKCEAPRGWRCTYQVGPQTKSRKKVHDERKQ